MSSHGLQLPLYREALQGRLVGPQEVKRAEMAGLPRSGSASIPEGAQCGEGDGKATVGSNEEFLLDSV